MGKLLFLIHRLQLLIFVSFSLMNCILNCLTEETDDFKVAKNTARIFDPKLIELFSVLIMRTLLLIACDICSIRRNKLIFCVFGTIIIKHDLNRNEQIKMEVNVGMKIECGNKWCGECEILVEENNGRNAM